MKPRLVTIAGQPSWVIRSDDVELAVTRLGGHMAPVTFFRSCRRPVQPYYVSPWQGERRKVATPVLVPLRGDFFCMPFGGGAIGRESHPAHGETATRPWALLSSDSAGGRTTLTLAMRTAVRPGKVTKRLTLVDGQNVIYSQHVLEGFGRGAGPMPLGHHATLAMPEQERTVHLATSPIRYGRTNPVPPGRPGEGEYFSLAVGRKFADLSSVPTIWKEPAFDDCSSFPARSGFCDLLAVFSRRADFPAWTTATFERRGFLWFSLKDPAMLPTLMIWVENRGRHGEPWCGRNNCLGLEDVCGYFAMGLPWSARPNVLNEAGIPTGIALSPREATVVNYIQGAVRTPRGFGKVRTVCLDPGRAIFVSTGGREVSARVNWEFLRTGEVSA